MEKQPIDLEEFIKGTSRKYKKNQASNQNKYRDRNLRQLQFEERRRQEEGNMRRQEEYDEEEYEEMKREHEMTARERQEENMRELQEEYEAKLQEDEEYMRQLQEDDLFQDENNSESIRMDQPSTSNNYNSQASNQNDFYRPPKRNLRHHHFNERRRQQMENVRKQRDEKMRKFHEEYRRNPEKYDNMDDDEWEEEYNKMVGETAPYPWSTPPIDWVLDGNNSNSNKMDQPSTSSNSQASKQTQRTQLYPNVDPNLPFLRQRHLAHLQVVEEERRRQEEENNNNNQASNQASNQVKKHPWGSTWPTEEEKEESRRRREEEDRRFAEGAREDPYRSWFEPQPSVNTSMPVPQLASRHVYNNQMEGGGRGSEWDNDDCTTDDDDDEDYDDSTADDDDEDYVWYPNGREYARRQRERRNNPPQSDLSSLQPSPAQQMRQPSPAQQMRQPSPAQQMRQDDSWREPLPSVNTFMARHMHNIQMEGGGRGSEEIKEEDADEWDEWARQERAHYNPNVRVGDDDVFYDDDNLQEAENYATMCGIDVNEVEQHWERVEQRMTEELHELQHYLEYFQNKRRELEPLYDRAAEDLARAHETFIISEQLWKKNLAFVYGHKGCPSASTHEKNQCYQSEIENRRAESTLKERKRALNQWEEKWNNLCWSLRMADGKIKALARALRNREGWFYLSDEHLDLADDLFENWQEYA